MKMRIAASVALLVSVTATAAAQQQPPAPGQPRELRLPAIRTATLANGLELRMVQVEGTPKAAVALMTITGNADDPADKPYLADLVGDMLEQGTATRTAEEVALEAARMGGDLNVSVAMNQTMVSGSALEEFAPDMVRLIADVMVSPRMPESELPRLKEDLARQVSVARTLPGQLAAEKFRSVLYPEQAYGRPLPTEAQIRSYTMGDVRSFFDQNYGADRSYLYVTGRFDPTAVEAAARTAFASWKRGLPAATVEVSPESARQIHIVDRPGAVQTTIHLGLPTIEPGADDWVPLLVTNALLGGYFSSRITSNIREDKGYTYSPGSSVTMMRGTSFYRQVADVTTNVTGPALKEIFYEIDRLQSEPPTEAELRGVKNYLIGSFTLQTSSRGGLIGWLSNLDLYGLPESYLRNYVTAINSVTPQQIQQAARRYLDDERMTIVLVGDRSVIEEQVAPYAGIAE